MAQPCTRTYADDIGDALDELDQAITALQTWRSHLAMLRFNPEPTRTRGVARAKNIAMNLVIDAAGHTQQACDALTPTAAEWEGDPHRHSEQFAGRMCHDHDDFGYHCHDLAARPDAFGVPVERTSAVTVPVLGLVLDSQRSVRPAQ